MFWEEMAIQGDHSHCTECQGSYAPQPSLKDIPQPPPFTNEMREYVNYWEANLISPRNPQTRRALKKGGRVWYKCSRQYSEYKKLHDPEDFRSAELRKAQLKHADKRQWDRDRCRQIHNRAVATSSFVLALSGNYTCAKCTGQARKTKETHECHMCSDWFGGSSCKCWTSLRLECEKCKVTVSFSINYYGASEEEVKSSSRARVDVSVERSPIMHRNGLTL